jgi:Phosphatidylinositol-specific phospholipase C, X domain/Phosphatidylinositol-specific phospholipase C, Y domain/C2 domain
MDKTRGSLGKAGNESDDAPPVMPDARKASTVSGLAAAMPKLPKMPALAEVTAALPGMPAVPALPTMAELTAKLPAMPAMSTTPGKSDASTADQLISDSETPKALADVLPSAHELPKIAEVAATMPVVTAESESPGVLPGVHELPALAEVAAAMPVMPEPELTTTLPDIPEMPVLSTPDIMPDLPALRSALPELPVSTLDVMPVLPEPRKGMPGMPFSLSVASAPSASLPETPYFPVSRDIPSMSTSDMIPSSADIASLPTQIPDATTSPRIPSASASGAVPKLPTAGTEMRTAPGATEAQSGANTADTLPAISGTSTSSDQPSVLMSDMMPALPSAGSEMPEMSSVQVLPDVSSTSETPTAPLELTELVAESGDPTVREAPTLEEPAAALSASEMASTNAQVPDLSSPELLTSASVSNMTPAEPSPLAETPKVQSVHELPDGLLSDAPSSDGEDEFQDALAEPECPTAHSLDAYPDLPSAFDEVISDATIAVAKAPGSSVVQTASDEYAAPRGVTNVTEAAPEFSKMPEVDACEVLYTSDARVQETNDVPYTPDLQGDPEGVEHELRDMPEVPKALARQALAVPNVLEVSRTASAVRKIPATLDAAESAKTLSETAEVDPEMPGDIDDKLVGCSGTVREELVAPSVESQEAASAITNDGSIAAASAYLPATVLGLPSKPSADRQGLHGIGPMTETSVDSGQVDSASLTGAIVKPGHGQVLRPSEVATTKDRTEAVSSGEKPAAVNGDGESQLGVEVAAEEESGVAASDPTDLAEEERGVVAAIKEKAEVMQVVDGETDVSVATKASHVVGTETAVEAAAETSRVAEEDPTASTDAKANAEASLVAQGEAMSAADTEAARFSEKAAIGTAAEVARVAERDVASASAAAADADAKSVASTFESARVPEKEAIAAAEGKATPIDREKVAFLTEEEAAVAAAAESAPFEGERAVLDVAKAAEDTRVAEEEAAAEEAAKAARVAERKAAAAEPADAARFAEGNTVAAATADAARVAEGRNAAAAAEAAKTTRVAEEEEASAAVAEAALVDEVKEVAAAAEAAEASHVAEEEAVTAMAVKAVRGTEEKVAADEAAETASCANEKAEAMAAVETARIAEERAAADATAAAEERRTDHLAKEGAAATSPAEAAGFAEKEAESAAAAETAILREENATAPAAAEAPRAAEDAFVPSAVVFGHVVVEEDKNAVTAEDTHIAEKENSADATADSVRIPDNETIAVLAATASLVGNDDATFAYANDEEAITTTPLNTSHDLLSAAPLKEIKASISSMALDTSATPVTGASTVATTAAGATNPIVSRSAEDVNNVVLSASTEPTVVRSGTLYKQGGSKRTMLARKATKRRWRRKQCEILSDGTFRYVDAGFSSLSSPASSSSSSDDEEEGDKLEGNAVGPTVTLPLLPGGAQTLSRVAQMKLAEALPASLDAAHVFSLRTRGHKAVTVMLCGESVKDAASWRMACNEGSLGSSIGANGSDHDMHHLLESWESVRKTSDGCVAVEDIAGVLRHANARIPTAVLTAVLSKTPRANADRLKWLEFIATMHDIVVSPGAQDLFMRSGGELGVSRLSASQLARILQVKESEATAILAARGGQTTCSLYLMQELLCAAENGALDPSALAPGAELLTMPLSHYYINSSHNTYLLGDQLQSASSVAMYRLVLEGGARCVEIDMWDGVSEPCVTHGHTLTSAIPFRKVIECIKENAFVTSPYPVILSLENHMSEAMQLTAAKDMREVLGDSLYVLPDDLHAPLPSPEDLKGKILIKAKKCALRASIAGCDDDYDEDDDEENETPQPINITTAATSSDTAAAVPGVQKVGKGKRMRKLFRRVHSLLSNSSDAAKQSSATGPSPAAKSSDSPSLEPEKENEKKKTLVVAKELSQLISFGGGNRKKLMELWATGTAHPDDQATSEIISINEDKVASTLANKDTRDMFCIYNKRNVTRVYPRGSRVDSSNYNPMPAWSAGCQLVSLNWQTADIGYWLNHGRFLANGNCGYASKTPTSTDGMSGAGTLDVKVLFGSLLPRPASRVVSSKRDVVDPYVQVLLASCGVDGSATMVERKTSTVASNGLSPCWRERLSLPVAKAGQDMLLVCVWDEDTTSKDDLIGFFCAPVRSLRCGIRSLNLLAKDGTPLTIPGSQRLPTIMCELGWTVTAE